MISKREARAATRLFDKLKAEAYKDRSESLRVATSGIYRADVVTLLGKPEAEQSFAPKARRRPIVLVYAIVREKAEP